MILILFDALMIFLDEWVFIDVDGQNHKGNKADKEG